MIITALLQNKALNQLHIYHMGIENTRLLALESNCWITMNDNIGDGIKNCPTCIDFQAIQPIDNTVSHEVA